MRALLLLASATTPFLALSVWSGLPGHADNNVFNLAELPPLPVEVSQRQTPHLQRSFLRLQTSQHRQPPPSGSSSPDRFRSLSLQRLLIYPQIN
jgi:hypothetical protein